MIYNDIDVMEVDRKGESKEKYITPVANKSKQNAFEPVSLPQFSQVLTPLLEGHMLTEADHSRLSSIMKDELNLFLK